MNGDKKTLLVLTPGFPRTEAETYWVPSQQQLVQSISETCPDLQIVVVSYAYPAESAEYSWRGIEVIALGATRRKPFLLAKLWRKARQIAHERHVGAVVSFWCREGAWVGKRIARSRKVPHLCWICGQDATHRNRMVRWIQPKGTELAAISDFVAEEFERNFRIRPRFVLPNGVRPDRFPVADGRTRNIDILGVGSLIPLKRFDLFIRVMAEIRKTVPQVQALIFGSGEDRDKLEELIHQLNLQNHIRIEAATAQETVLAAMQRSRILLHPSAYEGFSTVCLEAIYAGARVVSRTWPMKRAIANWLVVPTDTELASSCIQLLAMPDPEPPGVFPFDIRDSAKQLVDILQINSGHAHR